MRVEWAESFEDFWVELVLVVELVDSLPLFPFRHYDHAGYCASSHNSGKMLTTMTGHTPNEKEKK